MKRVMHVHTHIHTKTRTDLEQHSHYEGNLESTRRKSMEICLKGHSTLIWVHDLHGHPQCVSMVQCICIYTHRHRQLLTVTASTTRCVWPEWTQGTQTLV